jgi:tRNA 2-selenouridine synthase
MAVKRIAASQLFELAGEWVLLDVRTPAEYAHGHIPKAHNLPLFTDDERAEIGTLYKQVGPKQALLKGLEHVGPRMRSLVEEAQRLAPAGKVALHCWRGGQRSGSLAWLLDLAGLEVQVITGGYKAYRNHILDQFAARPARLLIIGGPTGAGKTEVLHALRQLGEQVIDLEGLAHHKGSAFGALGEAPQPTVEQFENDLFEAFCQLDPARPIWLENESRSIGRVYIPDPFWRRMQAAPLLQLEVPFEQRLARLVKVYAQYPQEQLAEAFAKIGKRLGGQHLKAALAALDAGDYEAAAAVALSYYDKAYAHHTLSKHGEEGGVSIPAGNSDPAVTARKLVAFAERVAG